MKLTYQDFQSLAVCNKKTFANGEKKKFSGVLNSWYFADNIWFFTYKQPLIRKFKEVTTPIHAYGQGILVIALFNSISLNTIKFYILSGDDDIIDFEFNKSYLQEVKDFVSQNFKSLDFENKIYDFAFEKGFIKYRRP